jgi:hypothetical protein
VRRGFEGQDLIYRDLEFMWDSLYAGGATTDVGLTLEKLAHALVDSTGRNPFRVPVSDINLVYDYFRRQGVPYHPTNPSDSSLIFGWHTESYNKSDRSHVDGYVFSPARNHGYGGIYPSADSTDDEDLSTGHAVGDVKHRNSLAVIGPPSSQTIDLTGTGWTAPDSIFNVTFIHEFQHGLPPKQALVFPTEFFSAGAEAIGGNPDTEHVTAEVPYTWSLLGQERSSAPIASAPECTGAPSPTCVRAINSNYQGRSLFAAYLAYNFRGTDTSATLAATTDDLLRRWARSPGERQLEGWS